MTEPEVQLLSLLEKVAHPLQNLSLNIKLNGVFAPPQQWKITDEANPNIFSYTLKVLGQDFVSGKIDPRKLTQKQQRELQQKNKKGTKKQSKQQIKQPQVDKAQQQRKQKQWDALSEEQKFHKTQQDPFKAFSLQFPEKNKQINYTKDNIEQFENKVNSDAIQIVLIRKPEMSQQDLQKLKKSKPKNLNLGQLYPMAYKGVIKTKQLQKPGATQMSERVKLTFDCKVPDDGIKIQTDSCYVYVQISLSEPVTPLVTNITPTLPQILPKIEAPTQVPPILKLSQQICKSIKAISQEYAQYFSKQKDHEEKRQNISSSSGMNVNLSNISTLKLNQITKRKELFLNEFVNSGKYNILRQRIAKVIKAIIIEKFRKQRTGSFTKKDINQTLSQLNLYFQEEIVRVVDNFIEQGDNGSIHEDLVLGYQWSRQHRKGVIAPIVSETEIQREMRLANQYQILQKSPSQCQKAETHYINVLLLSNNSIQAKQSYAKFCLKCQKFNQAYILYSQIAEESQQLQHKLIQAILLVDRRRSQQAEKLISQLMSNPQSKPADKIQFSLLLSFLYELQSQIPNSEKHLSIAQRYFKIKSNPHLKFTPPQNPYILPKPKVPKPQRYVSQLSHAQSQQIRLAFVSLLAEVGMFQLVGQYLNKIEQSNKKTILQIQVDVALGNYEQALNKIQNFLKKSDHIRNVEYLMIKADICYKSDKMFECEQIFLQILQLKPNPAKTLQIYLRLGYIYLSRKSWQDAKQVFEKACEQKYNCSVAWLGLGISNLNLNRYDEAEQALNLSKIYNPLSQETQQYEQKVNASQRNKYMSMRSKQGSKNLNDV